MSLALVAVETPVITGRRQRESQKTGCDAFVTVFGMDNQPIHATMSNAGEGGVQLTLDQRVPPSSLVKIEYADSFLLGEVVSCQAERSQWVAGVKVEHGLFGLTALAAALQESWS